MSAWQWHLIENSDAVASLAGYLPSWARLAYILFNSSDSCCLGPADRVLLSSHCIVANSTDTHQFLIRSVGLGFGLIIETETQHLTNWGGMTQTLVNDLRIRTEYRCGLFSRGLEQITSLDAGYTW